MYRIGFGEGQDVALRNNAGHAATLAAGNRPNHLHSGGLTARITASPSDTSRGGPVIYGDRSAHGRSARIPRVAVRHTRCQVRAEFAVVGSTIFPARR